MMLRTRAARTAAGVAAGGALLVLAAVGLLDREPAPIGARLALADAMAPAGAGFARALDARPFVFPDDHGAHPAFATEWWYVTGNVRTPDGRHFGYQLTFFRKALAPDPEPLSRGEAGDGPPIREESTGVRASSASGVGTRDPDRRSAWATRQAFMAHLALTDVEGDAFHAYDRFARAATGLAGAETGPLRIWLYDWQARSSGQATFPIRIAAAEADIAIDLVLQRGKAPVAHGERGLSRKGPERGNASYYYSLPRMPTHGTIRVAGEVFEVQGASWMDREWGTSALSAGVTGWDWFALQLNDGTELMLYRLRRQDGRASPYSGGTTIAADGSTRILSADEAAIDVLGFWTSTRDGARYPAEWRIRVPAERLALNVAPFVADQELDLAVRYWEGAVRVTGTRDGRSLEGVGYVELTGYAPDAGEAVVGRGR